MLSFPSQQSKAIPTINKLIHKSISNRREDLSLGARGSEYMIKMECLVMWNHVHAVILDFKDIVFSQACKAWLGTILACQWANAEC